MLELARVITLGALNRNESRGAHFKPEFPDRDDENFLKTTIAEYSGEGPVFSYEPVDVSLIHRANATTAKAKKEANVIIPPKTVEIHIRRRAIPTRRSTGNSLRFRIDRISTSSRV